MPERFVCHDGTEVGTANSDVADAADALPGMALPSATPHPVAKFGHAPKNGVDLRHDVLPVDNDRCAGRSAQRGMKNCAVLRDVDLAAGKHGVDAFPQARVCELEQKIE